MTRTLQPIVERRLKPLMCLIVMIAAVDCSPVEASLLSYGGYASSDGAACEVVQVYDSAVPYSCESIGSQALASIYAQATYGSLHTAVGAAVGDTVLPYASAVALITASFGDALTFANAPAKGAVDIEVTTEGHTSVGCSVLFNCVANTSLQGNGNIDSSQFGFNVELPNGSSKYDLLLPFDYSNAVGYTGSLPVSFSFFLLSQAFCPVQESCSVISDFSNTAFVSAVSLFDDANQKADASFTSESGTVYPVSAVPLPTAVPEPSSVALMCVGLVWLLLHSVYAATPRQSVRSVDSCRSSLRLQCREDSQDHLASVIHAAP